MSEQTVTTNEYFGGCPVCGKQDGMINIGPSHWFYCKTHKTSWTIGTNIFSGWKGQTEAEQRRIYSELGFGEFTEVKPVFPDRIIELTREDAEALADTVDDFAKNLPTETDELARLSASMREFAGLVRASASAFPCRPTFIGPCPF